MPLLTISNPEELTAGAAHGPQGLPLVRLPGTGFDCSLLKLGDTGCCEVLGYQLAPRLGVPVIPAVPVWCPQSFWQAAQAADEGRIGLAIQYVETFKHVTWEQAASQAPETVAAVLVLCLLDRCEWGQFARTKFGLVFYDLERLFPGFCPVRLDGETWCDVADRVSAAAGDYRRVAALLVPDVLGEAARLGLTDLLRLAVENAATIPIEELRKLFDLEPHPLAACIAGIAADVCVMQFGNIARLIC